MRVGTLFGWRFVPRFHVLTHGRADCLIHLFVHGTDGGTGSYASVCGRIRTLHVPLRFESKLAIAERLRNREPAEPDLCEFCSAVSISGLTEIRLEDPQDCDAKTKGTR